MPEYEGVVGLEVHIQLKTRTKLFCGCSTTFGAEPNTSVCPLCLGLPGALPVLNKTAVDYSIMMALALGSNLNEKNIFARKNYFYPDLPKGYQISQFDFPLATGGTVLINDKDNNQKKVRINRLHLEEEAGKSFHDIDARYSYIDFNRCGIPLIEIITEPDLSDGVDAYNFLYKIKQIAEYLDITTGSMEEGALRCDVNVSVRPAGDKNLYARHEIKNMNSFRFARKAIDYEIETQIEVTKGGDKIARQTMLWDEKKNITRAMREKEGAEDYRYFPEPDLRHVKIDAAWINSIKPSMPELPDEKHNRFIEQYKIREEDVRILTSTRTLADYYEETARLSEAPDLTANWIINELLREIKDVDITQTGLTAKNLGLMIGMVNSGRIYGKMAKDIMAEMLKSGKPAEEIIQDKGIRQISDEIQIQTIIENVLSENEDNVKLYLGGKKGLFKYFIGEVMKATGGRADPKLVNNLLTGVLESRRQNDA